MEKLMEILMEINPDIDYKNEKNLIDGKILDSFSIVNLVSQISETFDIEISPKYLIPKYFNSVDAMWEMIQAILDEE